MAQRTQKVVRRGYRAGTIEREQDLRLRERGTRRRPRCTAKVGRGRESFGARGKGGFE